jgi:glycosyltransferase involved in cell wall biosynthesis
MSRPDYLLITPAWNEEEFIELTIKSVIAQTARPVRWVIVSDGSTDGTDDIVRSYLPANPWIELRRMPERRERHFAGKANAFKAGYDSVKHLPHDAVCCLDADTSFDAEYFAFLTGKLASGPELGLVGTHWAEDNKVKYDYRFVSIEHVSGCCQMFRRQCYEDIGGYVPAKSGGIDHIAVLSARMKGWKTRTFTDKICHHHRRIGTADSGVLHTWFKNGWKDYILGGHPLWEFFRVLYQMSHRPYLLSGVLLGAGYTWAALCGAERPVTAEIMAFRRREQMVRLRSLFGLGDARAPGVSGSHPTPGS